MRIGGPNTGKWNGDFDLDGNELIQNQTILDQQVFPGYHFDGASGAVQVSDDASFVGLFAKGGTFICKFNAFSAGELDSGFFMSKSANISLYSTGGEWEFVIGFSGTNGVWHSTGTDVPLNKDSIVVVMYNGSSAANNVAMYVDGVEVSLTRATAPVGTISSDAGNLYIGNRAGDDVTFEGNIYKTIFLNRVLAADEAKSFSSNPQKAVGFADEGASNADLTAGTVTLGKNYRTTDFIAGDDFTNVASIGAGANVDGAEWTCIAATPTTWANSSVLHQIGATLELKPQDATEDVWFDSSGNGNDGAVSGALLTNKSQVQIAGQVEDVGAFTATKKVKVWIDGVAYHAELDPV